MHLSDNTITLRPVEPSDLDFLYLLENSEGAERSGFNTAPVSRQMLWDYIESYNADIFAAKELRLVISEAAGGRAVGTVDISDFDARSGRGFAGIIIDEAHRRRGYGTRALNMLCRYAADTLSMHRLAAMIAADNYASHALFSRCGFSRCGSMPEWFCRRGNKRVDAILYSKSLQNL